MWLVSAHTQKLLVTKPLVNTDKAHWWLSKCTNVKHKVRLKLSRAPCSLTSPHSCQVSALHLRLVQFLNICEDYDIIMDGQSLSTSAYCTSKQQH